MSVPYIAYATVQTPSTSLSCPHISQTPLSLPPCLFFLFATFCCFYSPYPLCSLLLHADYSLPINCNYWCHHLDFTSLHIQAPTVLPNYFNYPGNPFLNDPHVTPRPFSGVSFSSKATSNAQAGTG